MKDWSISEVAKLAGTTSRALRHYGEVGLLPASRIGAGGYRHYDADALVRLQRILLLRELGLSLPQIGEILERPTAAEASLAHHLEWLSGERERIDRQIAAVRSTITALEKGEEPMVEDMFDGFDHATYKDEVIERWGERAYAESDRWWTGLDDAERGDWKEQTAALGAAWQDAAERGIPADGAEAQALAARHVAWLRGVPGTPASTKGGELAGYLRGLGEMYVADPRFAANYGGTDGAVFVRDALRVFADRL